MDIINKLENVKFLTIILTTDDGFTATMSSDCWNVAENNDFYTIDNAETLIIIPKECVSYDINTDEISIDYIDKNISLLF